MVIKKIVTRDDDIVIKKAEPELERRNLLEQSFGTKEEIWKERIVPTMKKTDVVVGGLVRKTAKSWRPEVAPIKRKRLHPFEVVSRQKKRYFG